MKRKDDFFIPCLVRHTAPAGTASDAGECVFAQSVRKLDAPELTDKELQELGFGRPATGGVREPAKVAKQTRPNDETTSWMVEATMNVIADQIRNVDLEAEMLSLRKRALKRRLRILERLAKSLKPCDEDRKAA